MILDDVRFCPESHFVLDAADKDVADKFIQAVQDLSAQPYGGVSVKQINTVLDKIIVTLSFRYIDAYEHVHKLYAQLSKNR